MGIDSPTQLFHNENNLLNLVFSPINFQEDSLKISSTSIENNQSQKFFQSDNQIRNSTLNLKLINFKRE